MNEKLLTVRELAKDVLNVSESKIYLLIETERLPFIKVGRIYRFERNEVLEYLKNKNNREKNDGHSH